MSAWILPRTLGHVGTPTLKCQGIKTKLVRFIAQSVAWSPGSVGRWIEPFVGTGVVPLNLLPPRALLADINPHVVRVLRDIQSKALTAEMARAVLDNEGRRLAEKGEGYYYEVRERFNADPTSLDFIFLNRSCFNGVIRFNKKGRFNTPFGHKPKRFDASFLTRVTNQIKWTAQQMSGREWEIVCADWRDTIREARETDFVYLDPPYIGRHVDYYSQWGETEADSLSREARALPCGYALSMWMENKYRVNDHIPSMWPNHPIRKASHFYHVGSSEALRNEMLEALVIRPGYETDDKGTYQTKRSKVDPEMQLSLLDG
jgi:DNA adenine methylase